MTLSVCHVHSLFQCCSALLMFVGICLALLRCHHGTTVILFFSSVIPLVLRLCLASLSCRTTHFQPGFSCQTHGLTSDSSVNQGIHFAVQRSSWFTRWIQSVQFPVTPPPPCFTAAVRCLCCLLCITVRNVLLCSHQSTDANLQ